MVKTLTRLTRPHEALSPAQGGVHGSRCKHSLGGPNLRLGAPWGSGSLLALPSRLL